MAKRNVTRAIKSEFIDCRNFAHAWKPYDVVIKGRTYEQSVVCTRCKTIKRFHIDCRTGELVSGSSYSYPEGYQVPGGRLAASERGALRLIGVRAARR